MSGAGTGYIVAGYSICLSVLFLYAVSLVLRRRRLARAAAVADRDATVTSPPPVPPAAGLPAQVDR